MEAREVLTSKVETGARVIVIGGGLVGCETGEFLAERGKKVTILEMQESMASEMEFSRRQLLLDRLADKRVSMLTKVKCERVSAGDLPP